MHYKKSGLYERHAKIACTKRKKSSKAFTKSGTTRHLEIPCDKSVNIGTPTQCVINPINPSSIYTSILGSTYAYLFPQAQCREKCEKVEKGALKIECTGTVNTANSGV